MKVFKREGAITAFYYLLTADGAITEDELQTFDEIGNELDPDNFLSYRDRIINVCTEQIARAESEDEVYDLIQEGMDYALSETVDDPEEGIPPRLLLWDLLIVAYSNEDYDSNERRLIRHIVRVMDIEKSVYLEMERIADTSVSLKQEYAWVQTLDRPYAEVRPIVDELEKRMVVLRESALNLISDEIIKPEKEESSFDKFMASVDEKISPKIEKTTETIDNTKKNIQETISPWGDTIKEKSGKFFSSLSKGAKDTISASVKTLTSFVGKGETEEDNTDAADEKELDVEEGGPEE